MECSAGAGAAAASLRRVCVGGMPEVAMGTPIRHEGFGSACNFDHQHN